MVVKSDGQPAARAQVIAVTNDFANLEGGFPLDDDLFGACTDDQGRFSFQAMAPPNSLLTLYAAHPAGTAMVPHDAYQPGASIGLEPWVTLQGRAVSGGEPRQDVEIELSCSRIPGNTPYLLNAARTRTGADGRFTFDRVPAGFHGSMRRLLGDGSHGFGIGYTSLPDPAHDYVESLQPKRLDLEGCTVKGRVQVPAMNRPFISAIIHLARQDLVFPSGFEALSKEKQHTIFRDWFESQAGFQTRQSTCYTVIQVDSDGRFRVEDVPPGELEILIEIDELHWGPLSDLWRRIRRVPRSVRIVHRFENPGDRGQIDLGLIS